jgi:hypothetical protein
MFFTTKSSVRRGAYKETVPFVATLEETGGLPTGFWQDPYVVGWFNGMIGSFIKIIGKGKFGPADVGTIVDGVLEDLAGRVTAERVARDIVLLREGQDPDFRDGTRNAEMLIAVTFGSRDFDDHADVIMACSSTEQASGARRSQAVRHAEMCVKLQELLFYDRVRP